MTDPVIPQRPAPPGSLASTAGGSTPVAPAYGGQLLLIAAVVSAVLWQVPYGNWVLYPFTILATWFHEMGHGVAALVLGGELERLRLFSDGSGVAEWRASGFGRFALAIVAAGGPLGPPLAGAGFILAGRTRLGARIGLLLLGLVLIWSVLFYVRSLFGVMVIALWAAAVLTVALLARPWAQSLVIQFLGVQACVSTFQSADYLFRRQAVIGGEIMWSDTGQIAQALWLPHWLWGSLIAVAAVGLLLASLWLAYRRSFVSAKSP